MNIKELSGNIFYIEDAFPMHREFIEAIELNNNNKMINSVIPPWSEWIEGHTRRNNGFVKMVDWDYSINDKNWLWPRINVEPDYSSSHSLAYEIIKMIDKPYGEVLKAWAKKTGNEEISLITKNYTIKKYIPGGKIYSHTDRDNSHDFNTFDWTALVYLNDDYTGGDIIFDNLGHRVSPKAGSILIFSADEAHTAEEILTGNKYFLFFYIQSLFGFTHSIKEQFAPIVENIKKDRRS